MFFNAFLRFEGRKKNAGAKLLFRKSDEKDDMSFTLIRIFEVLVSCLNNSFNTVHNVDNSVDYNTFLDFKSWTKVDTMKTYVYGPTKKLDLGNRLRALHLCNFEHGSHPN